MEIKEFLPLIFNWILPVAIILVLTYLLFKNLKSSKSFIQDLDKSSINTNASFLSRFVAFWIDVQIFSLITQSIIVILPFQDYGERMISLSMWVLFVVYKIVFEFKKGQTFGKTLMGIQVVSEIETPLQLVHIIKRNVYYLVLLIIVVLDKVGIMSLSEDNEMTNVKILFMLFFIIIPISLNFFWYFVKDKGLTLQDKFGSTKVNKVSPLHRHFWWFIIGMFIISNILKNIDKFLLLGTEI